MAENKKNKPASKPKSASKSRQNKSGGTSTPKSQKKPANKRKSTKSAKSTSKAKKNQMSEGQEIILKDYQKANKKRGKSIAPKRKRNVKPDPTTGNNNVNNEEAYRLFLLWNTIPAQFKGISQSKLKEMGFDRELLEIAKHKTQSSLAKFLGVSRQHLQSWKGTNKFQVELQRMQTNSISDFFGSMVDHSFTQATIKHADAARVALWNKLYRNWDGDNHLHVHHHHELTIDKESALNITPEMVFTVALNRIAATRGIDITKIHRQITEGFYSKLNKVAKGEIEGAEADKIKDDFEFPSQANFDIDDLENRAEQRKKSGAYSDIEEAEEVTEEEEIENEKKAWTEKKNKLLEKLNSKKTESMESEKETKQHLKELLKKKVSKKSKK